MNLLQNDKKQPYLKKESKENLLISETMLSIFISVIFCKVDSYCLGLTTLWFSNATVQNVN